MQSYQNSVKVEGTRSSPVSPELGPNEFINQSLSIKLVDIETEKRPDRINLVG